MVPSGYLSGYPLARKAFASWLTAVDVRRVTRAPPRTSIENLAAPKIVRMEMASTSSRRTTRSGIHQDQCQDRMPRDIGETSTMPKGQGRLLHPPVDAVTRKVNFPSEFTANCCTAPSQT